MSFFREIGSNPLATPIGQLIERATDGSQPTEDWALLMEICDVINEADDGSKDAMKAIRKRLSQNVGKNYKVVMYVLTVLETCVKNCGKRFHVLVASKDFLQEFIKIISPKNDPPQIVQEKVLSLVQTWADAFQGSPDLKEVGKVYQDLKNKGIEFPMTDLDNFAPIHTPARSAPEVHSIPTDHQRQITGPPRGPAYSPTSVPVTHSHQQEQSGPMLLGPQQLAKLRSELQVVQQNCRIFSEMLTELSPAQEQSSDMELLQDLNSTSRQMQNRVVKLIETVQNEEVTGELLRINDELNNVSVRYDRFMRLRASHAESNTDSGPPTYASATAASDNTSALDRPHSAADESKPVEQHSPVENLIDLDTPGPQPEIPDTNPFASSTSSDINRKLAGLNVGSNSARGTIGEMATTNETNPKPYQDDFDMFAHSRQSFDQSRQALGDPPSYTAQQQQQFAGGLGAAVNAKGSAGNPYQKKPTDTEGEYEEMEKWLEQNAKNTQESATSSEFDNFLAQRADEVEQLPNAQGTSSARNNPRQMRKDDTDNTLFAL